MFRATYSEPMVFIIRSVKYKGDCETRDSHIAGVNRVEILEVVFDRWVKKVSP